MSRVLVIEDHPHMRDLLRRQLEGDGYAVETAADGEEGLRLQAAQPADLVITDIFMPNVDGIETISRLRVEYPRTKSSRSRAAAGLCTARITSLPRERPARTPFFASRSSGSPCSTRCATSCSNVSP